MKKTKASKSSNPVVVNRRAHYDYHLGDDLEVGLCLTGDQVRLIRDHHAQIRSSYITIRRNELWLVGLTLGAETAVDIKLLATKKQIASLLRQKSQGFTIVPTKLLPNKRHIKLVIAVGKGKKNYDKRQTIKHRDLDRESRL